MVNFNIELAKIGEISMQNIVVVGIFAIVLVLIWQFSNILNAIVNFLKFRDGKK